MPARRDWNLGPFHLALDVSMINRPHVIGWRDGTHAGAGLSWGNGNSDPVWSIDFTLPAWVFHVEQWLRGR